MADPILFELQAENGFHMATSVIRDGYRVSKSANFNAINILARSSPIFTYANSGPIEMTITTELVDIDEEQTSDMVKSLLSLCFPIEPGVKPPPLCKVSVGKEFEDWECVVTHVEVQPGNRNLWAPDGKARSAAVTLSLIGIEIENVPSSDYLKLSDWRQLVFDGGAVA